MKIAIIGTRGIPNNYGGFEQFAEYVSVFLSKKGHEILCILASELETDKSATGCDIFGF